MGLVLQAGTSPSVASCLGFALSVVVQALLALCCWDCESAFCLACSVTFCACSAAFIQVASLAAVPGLSIDTGVHTVPSSGSTVADAGIAPASLTALLSGLAWLASL